MARRRTVMRLLLTAVLLALTACSAASDGVTGGSSGAACAAVVEYDGARYTGHGDLRRTPEVTGRTEQGVLLGCDDGGGDTPDEAVVVEELADLPLSRGFLALGSVHLRDGARFPEEIRSWFTRPRCDEAGSFELAGPWIGVRTTREIRFDGDLRAPYTVEVRVDDGPAAYVGTTLLVRATADTEPTLGPDDVKTSLWEGGDLRATVACDGTEFVATSLTSTSG